MPGIRRAGPGAESDLGLSTERRLAKLDDVSVNNVLCVDNSSRPLMKGGLAGLLAGAVTTKPAQVKDKRVTAVGIDEFLSGVLPQAQSMRVLIEPALAGSFVTLTTAVREGGPHCSSGTTRLPGPMQAA